MIFTLQSQVMLHYKELRTFKRLWRLVKRTGLVETFPFVDGRRPVKLLTGQTETKFSMDRCVDQTCAEIDNNAVLDISPDSEDDPMAWFKVSHFNI